MAINLDLLIAADQQQIAKDMGALSHIAAASPLEAGSADTAVSFSGAMMNAVSEVDTQNRVASDKMADVDSGRSDDLVGAMMLSQEASLSFSMLMQVRNKVVAAVDDLIKMPI